MIEEKPFAAGFFASVYKVKKRGDESNKVYCAKIFEDGKNFGMANEVLPL